MIRFPKAKINLGLAVMEKRLDGFHNVETVMLPLRLTDVLEIVPSKDQQSKLKLSGLRIVSDRKSNLVLRAWEIMQKKFDLQAVDIHLHKTIPSGAGLGGGSSDAAALVRLCNDQFKINLREEEMETLVRPLGSDCAFFIRGRSALATGKGDQLSPINLNLPSLKIVLVKPAIHINTKEAYSWAKPAKPKISIAQIVRLPIDQWKENLVNDFEIPVFEHYPVIKKIKDQLYHNGALYASLTGSGAALYGLFTKSIDLKNEFSNNFVWQGSL